MDSILGADLQTTVRAAGVLFVTKDGKALFLKRGPGGDHPGEWCFPGGTTEAGENAMQTAVRETIEEIGFLPKGERSELARTVSQGTPSPLGPEGMAITTMPSVVDFTTFLQKVDEEFVPVINGEHVGYAWAPIGEPPEALHPGCRVALERLTMDELGVARAIAAGSLTSPQKYGNLWLFAMRITGTGVAFRRAKNEFVFRQPENYLTDEFLARCNGLSVVWLHPESPTLTSKDFNASIVGSMMLPYIRGDEVWGVAKIYDADTANLLCTKQMSTSPGVVLGGSTHGDSTMTLDDGSKLLIEGKPILLDHLAICERGVWDKGGEPAGVVSQAIGDSDMTEEEKKALEAKEAKEAKDKKDAEEVAAKAKADADAGTPLDKMLSKLDSKLDSLCTRMDAMDEKERVREDKARKDAEESEAAEKAKKAKEEKEAKEKKDAEEAERRAKGDPAQVAADKAKKDEEEEKTRKDAEEARAKADAAHTGLTDVRAQIADLQNKMPRSMNDAEYAEIAQDQARFDSIYGTFGSRAGRPLDGEDRPGYVRRMLKGLKEHSPAWAKVDLTVLQPEALAIADAQICHDALEVGRSPATVAPGELRMISRASGTGHTINEFVGHPSVWMNDIAGPVRQFVTGFKTNQGSVH